MKPENHADVNSGKAVKEKAIRHRKPSSSFDDFVDLVEILRRECPWDRKQTHESLKDHLIEEAYEAVDAIERSDKDELSKELGDLLLQVVFHSQMASESRDFKIDDVIWRISEKLIRRHPHIFKDAVAETTDQVSRNWEKIKMSEGRDSVLDGLPVHLPALIRAHRMQEKAANVGFDWGDWKPAFEKVREELHEFEEALDNGNPTMIREEYGDLLFSLVNVSRLLGMQSEEALREAGTKFDRRFRRMEIALKNEGKEISNTTLEEMDRYWEEVKKMEKNMDS